MNLFHSAPRIEALSHIKVTQSLQGVSVPIIIGTTRVPALLIWWGDWSVANAVNNGKSKGKNSQYVYSASWIGALCQGPIYGVNSIWTGEGKFNPTPADPLTIAIQATPPTPTLSATAGGTLAATTYYVTVTYTATTAASNDESAHSPEASLAVAANNLLVVNSPPAQSGAAGWNVYVASTSGGETLQNTTPIAIGTNWTLPTSGLIGTGASHPANPVHRIPTNLGPIGADLGVLGSGGPFRRVLSS